MPVFTMSRMAQDRIREMQDRMNNMQQQEEARNTKQDKTIDGEYIDYEEVK